MKKPFFLAGAIVWAVIAAAALLLLASSLAGADLSGLIPGWTASGGIGGAFVNAVNSNTPLIKEEKFSAAGLNALEVSAKNQSIKITLTDGGEVAVRHYDIKSAPAFEAGVSGGKLSVDIQRHYITLFNISSPRLEIDLPRAFSGNVSLKSASGSISLGGRGEWGSVSLDSVSGAVRFVGGLKCADLIINTVSGSVSLGDTHAGTAVIGSVSGALRLENLTFSGEGVLKNMSGSINAGNIAAAGLNIKSGSGAVRARDINVARQLHISSASGSQDAGYVKADDFTIKGLSGSLRYSGISGAGLVDCLSGSINIGALYVKGDVTVNSLSGTQRLTLAPDQNADIKISVMSGTIHAAGLDLSYTDKKGKNANGKIGNGSGGTLSIRAASGSVYIK